MNCWLYTQEGTHTYIQRFDMYDGDHIGNVFSPSQIACLFACFYHGYLHFPLGIAVLDASFVQKRAHRVPQPLEILLSEQASFGQTAR